MIHIFKNAIAGAAASLLTSAAMAETTAVTIGGDHTSIFHNSLLRWTRTSGLKITLRLK